MIEIPKQLQNPEFRFLLLKKGQKEPLEKDWQNTKNYKFDDEKLQKHLNWNCNYGILGGFGNLILIDTDKKEIAEIMEKMPETFTVKTGSSEEYKKHYFYVADKKMKPIRLSKEKIGDLGDVRSVGQYVVAPNSIHPSGNSYRVIKDIPIANITEAKIREIFKEYIDETDSTEFKKYPIITAKRTSKYISFCRVPDYALNNKLKKDTAKNWKLFPYIVDILHNRDVDENVYRLLAKQQGHSIGAIKGWVKKAKEGKLARTSCEKMSAYLKRFHPELIGELCENCPCYTKESKEAEEFETILKDPELFNKINKEFDKTIIGESKSRKAIFLSLCNVWVDGSEIPLNTLVSSETSAGKSYICKQIVKIFPKEMVEYRTKITPEAFTYWHNREKDWSWNGKICYLEDISQSILDAPTFKVMCSEGNTATIVIKQRAYDLHIEGKPIMLITTARTNPSAEVLGRFQIVSLDESKEQTEGIVFGQARSSETGIVEKYNEELVLALSHLKRKKVIIPFAIKIATFLKMGYNFESIRLRRDFQRLLELIKCSAVLHQLQRKESDWSILANAQDYEIARECINYIQTQTFRGLTHRLKKAFDCCQELKQFTAKEIHAKFPFVNQKMWYIYLDKLSERNMLRTELIREEG